MGADRLTREQEFHDARFREGSAGRAADRFYAINRVSTEFFYEQLRALPRGSAVLDYGCGDGAYAAIEAARNGHRVVAFDLSPVAVEQARGHAREAGVEDLITFKVMNAEALELEPASFDFVCGLGILHHLELDASLREVAAVMKPTATAVFLEPLGHNPLINLYRSRTPDQRTIDEHPLLMADLQLMRQRFEVVDATYFHLLGLLALPMRGRPGFDQTLSVLDALDRVLLRTRVRQHAWMVGLRLARPRA